MRRWLPHPLLSLALWATWLLLNRSLGWGHVLLGLVLALWIPWLTAGLRPLPVRIRRPGVVLRLAGTIVWDATLSNLQAMRVLWAPHSPHRPPAGFVCVPLRLRDPNALAVLATITCITPGSAWAELSLDRSQLLLHLLERGDPEATIRRIQERYEQPLLEIFET